MVDIHNKSPSQQRKRWWTIPIPTKAYRDGWDSIFGPKKPTDEEIRAARYALAMAEHNDSIGAAIETGNYNEAVEVLKLRNAK